MIGRNVCYMHGGKSRRGPEHPRFKTGIRSKAMPERLRERFEEALSDERLLELDGDLALLETRLAGLLSKLEEGESSGRWKALEQAWRRFQEARARASVPDMEAMLRVMGALIEQGASEEGVWDEIALLLDQRLKLVNSERKHRHEQEQFVTLKEMATVFAAQMEILRRYITDSQVLGLIFNEFERNILSRAPRSLEAGTTIDAEG